MKTRSTGKFVLRPIEQAARRGLVLLAQPETVAAPTWTYVVFIKTTPGRMPWESLGSGLKFPDAQGG